MTIFDLLSLFLSPAFAQDGKSEGGDGPKNDTPKNDDEKPADPKGHGKDNDHDNVHEHDHNDPINTDSDKPSKRDVNETREHPLGDYSRALFDDAKKFVDDFAKQTPQARDLKEQFDEAERTRSLYESWDKATTSGPYSLRDAEDSSSHVTLLDAYHRVELAGMYLGLTPTSTNKKTDIHAQNSAHYKNGAVDFRVLGLPLARIEQAIFALRSAGILVRDERGWPARQKEWTAPHIHGQATPLTPKNGTLDRWSNPEWRPGTFMNFHNSSRPSDANLPTRGPVIRKP